MHARATGCLLVTAILFGSALGTCGCNRKTITERQDGDPAVQIHFGAAVTGEEANTFADAVNKAVADRDARAFDDLFDWDAVLDRATDGIDVPAKIRASFLTTLRAGNRGLGKTVTALCSQGASYTLLRTRTEGDQGRALFRVLPPAGGVNYHEFLLARRPSGQIKGVDLQVFVTGELFSTTMRRLIIPLVAQENQGFLDKLRGRENEFYRHISDIQRMGKARQDGQPSQALAIYRQLPASVRQDKTVQLIRLQAAQASGDDEEYLGAMEDFRASFPDDACMDLMCIDYYLLKKQYADALAGIDKVDKAVGGDPYLNLVRANANFESGKFAEAREAASKAIEDEPTMVEAYWSLVAISLREKKFDDTLKLLRMIATKFHVEFQDLAKVPEYADFVKSPQYKEWLKTIQGK
jgi:tetratricopeptide (TPR) repeat protein